MTPTSDGEEVRLSHTPWLLRSFTEVVIEPVHYVGMCGFVLLFMIFGYCVGLSNVLTAIFGPMCKLDAEAAKKTQSLKASMRSLDLSFFVDSLHGALL